MPPSTQPIEPVFPDELTVKIIGLGGVGSIVSEHVALWLAAMSHSHPHCDMRLVLIDGDAFESDNARMFFGRLGPKATVKCEDLHARLGDRLGRLSVVAVDEFVTPDNVGRLIHEGDVVLLCVDAHASRKVVSDHMESLGDGVLVSAGNDGVGADSAGIERRGTYGNCQVHIRRDGRDVTPPLTRYHPEIADPADRLPTDQSCTEALAKVPQHFVANCWAAATAFSTFVLALCEPGTAEKPGVLGYSELAFDFAEGMVTPVEIPAPVWEEKAISAAT